MKEEINDKVMFDYYDLEGNLDVESVWAAKEGNGYRIKNIPFFAPNIAYDDIISVEDDNGELFFDDIVEESGNSTLQIIIYNENDIEETIKKIESFDCGWEGSNLKGYISVNVPKEISYLPVKSFLSKELENKKLDYKEACMAHKI
ncbi:DUF4265 domain-containing protein [Flavobacterium pectinovorum]|uniref:DUF4265 domain-containing protein n=1 Tax=Flavobacterium pectinovorum TaxID=29533 RepID=A0A502E0I8_9FLAO|nr:DUF4265 domain-containing protein [Flavobacterium pectinovorum]TPG31113.1 DUF4265 domain-containing protein [Flavobacterium pectinovorum]